MGAFIDIAPSLPAGRCSSTSARIAACSRSSIARCRPIIAPCCSSLRRLSRRRPGLLALNGFDGRADVRACGIGDRAGRRQIVEDALGFAMEAQGGAAGAEAIEIHHDRRRVAAGPAWRRRSSRSMSKGPRPKSSAGRRRCCARPARFSFSSSTWTCWSAAANRPAALLAQLTAAGYRFTEPGGRSRSARSLSDSLRAIVRIVCVADG